MPKSYRVGITPSRRSFCQPHKLKPLGRTAQMHGGKLAHERTSELPEQCGKKNRAAVGSLMWRTAERVGAGDGADVAPS
jgi:hypothetical protein